MYDASAPFIVAVGGTSGAGKSTLVRHLAAALGEASSLHFDDYECVSHYPADLADWLRAGADPDAWQTPQMREDLQALRRGQSISPPRTEKIVEPGRFLVVEEPFGRQRQEVAAFFDFVVYISLPLELALARKLHRDLNAPGLQDPRKAVDYIQAFLPRYIDSIRDVYAHVDAIGRRDCDLLVDGRTEISVVTAQVVDRIQAEILRFML